MIKGLAKKWGGEAGSKPTQISHVYLFLLMGDRVQLFFSCTPAVDCTQGDGAAGPPSHLPVDVPAQLPSVVEPPGEDLAALHNGHRVELARCHGHHLALALQPLHPGRLPEGRRPAARLPSAQQPRGSPPEVPVAAPRHQLAARQHRQRVPAGRHRDHPLPPQLAPQPERPAVHRDGGGPAHAVGQAAGRPAVEVAGVLAVFGAPHRGGARVPSLHARRESGRETSGPSLVWSHHRHALTLGLRPLLLELRVYLRLLHVRQEGLLAVLLGEATSGLLLVREVGR